MWCCGQVGALPGVARTLPGARAGEPPGPCPETPGRCQEQRTLGVGSASAGHNRRLDWQCRAQEAQLRSQRLRARHTEHNAHNDHLSPSVVHAGMPFATSRVARMVVFSVTPE